MYTEPQAPSLAATLSRRASTARVLSESDDLRVLILGAIGATSAEERQTEAAREAAITELAAIGRNINQTARAINAKIMDAEPVPAAMLTALSIAIQDNRAAIRARVQASQNAWKASQ